MCHPKLQSLVSDTEVCFHPGLCERDWQLVVAHPSREWSSLCIQYSLKSLKPTDLTYTWWRRAVTFRDVPSRPARVREEPWKDMVASLDLAVSLSSAAWAWCWCQGRSLAFLIKWFENSHLRDSTTGSSATACQQFSYRVCPKRRAIFCWPCWFSVFCHNLLNQNHFKDPNQLDSHVNTTQTVLRGGKYLSYVPLNPLLPIYLYLLCVAYGWTMEIRKQTPIQQVMSKVTVMPESRLWDKHSPDQRPLLQRCCLHSYIPVCRSL